jgi:uncharacterized membrane protein YidH (DUF202 family)
MKRIWLIVLVAVVLVVGAVLAVRYYRQSTALERKQKRTYKIV